MSVNITGENNIATSLSRSNKIGQGAKTVHSEAL